MAPGRDRQTKRQVLAALAVLPVLVLSGCGSGGGYTPDAGTAQGPGVASVDSTRVVVTETEFSISVPNSQLDQGMYTFVVENAGAVPHDLVIMGPGVESQSTARIEGGGSSELTVNLEPGTYQLWCSVGNHRQLGMSTEITVR